MSELRAAQLLFTTLLPGLLDRAVEYAAEQGIEVALGESWRSPEEAARLADAGLGIRASLHCERLAQDLLLRVVNGDLINDAAMYEPLGVYWEGLHASCRWGGRFKNAKGFPRPDPDHFSLAFQGRA